MYTPRERGTHFKGDGGVWREEGVGGLIKKLAKLSSEHKVEFEKMRIGRAF